MLRNIRDTKRSSFNHIVIEAHACVCHDGVKETLTEIRQIFWIHQCVACRKFEGLPFKDPPPPPLPSFRVKKDPAFTYQSTHTFIWCLKRFAARRGLPQRFLTDNGKMFKSAVKYIDLIFKQEIVQNYFIGLGVEWSFNVRGGEEP